MSRRLQTALKGTTWFGGRRRLAAAPGRLLLARVRHQRGRAAVLRRPRRPRRRPPQGVVGPRRAARRASACCTPRATSASASTPTAGSRRASPTSPRCRSASSTPASRSPSTSPATRSRPTCGAPTSGASRCTCSTPTSRATRPTASPSPTASTAATSTTACARRSCSASAASAPCAPSASQPDVFHTNEGHAGFLGLERIRELVAAGLSFERGHRGRARRRRVHDAHAGAGRHRPLPARADGGVLHVVRQGARRHVRRAVRARRARRRAGRQVQHGRDGPAPRRPLERRRQAARRRQPGDVPGPVARPRGRRGADRLDHERRARAHVGRRRASTRCCRASSARTGTAPTPSAGRGVREVDPMEAWSDAQRRPRRARAPRPPAPRRGRARLVGADDRVRPPLRHLQAGHAAAVGPRPPAGAAARRRAPGAVRVRRQGPPGRQPGQGADPAHRAVRPPRRRAPPLRVPRRLRHLDRPGDVPRLRRVAEHAAPAARGVRDVGHEGGAQRRAQLQHPRRLVGRVLRRRRNGWAIESAEDDPDQDRRDLREAASLFGILENQVVPRFYDRGRDGVPRAVGRRWCSRRGRRSAREVTAARMVRDYTTGPVRAGRRVVDPPGVRRRQAGRRAGGVARARRRRRGTACRSRPSSSTTRRRRPASHRDRHRRASTSAG